MPSFGNGLVFGKNSQLQKKRLKISNQEVT